MTHKEALKKLMKYCAYQERCQKEVREKLYEIEAPTESIEHIITELISENFLNEERFATSYARGKFYYKQWGKKKIEQELKFRNISTYCINKGFKEIDNNDYIATLSNLCSKKLESLGGSLNINVKNKIQNYLYNKGYESDLIWQCINELENEEK